MNGLNADFPDFSKLFFAFICSSLPDAVTNNLAPKNANDIPLEPYECVHHKYANEIVQKFIYSKNRLKEVLTYNL